MRKQTVRLVGDTQRAYAKRLIDNAPLGHVMLLGEETRTDAQNRLMWPLFDDLRAQVPEHAQFTAEQTKLRFLDALGSEMVHLPKLGNAGYFPVGQRSSTLTKTQFSLLIELILLEGDRHGVRWSQRSLNTKDEVLAA
jgi:hypothetical protein